MTDPILLVDDETEFVQTLAERLELRDIHTRIALNGEQALEMISRNPPRVMVLDLKMPGIDGMEVLRKVKKSHPAIEIIILTGHGSERDKAQALETGALSYLLKPVRIDTLMETIVRAARVSDSG